MVFSFFTFFLIYYLCKNHKIIYKYIQRHKFREHHRNNTENKIAPFLLSGGHRIFILSKHQFLAFALFCTYLFILNFSTIWKNLIQKYALFVDQTGRPGRLVFNTPYYKFNNCYRKSGRRHGSTSNFTVKTILKYKANWSQTEHNHFNNLFDIKMNSGVLHKLF